jgi:hypothetical protein
MKKVKLPRKRKKAFIKAKGKGEYIASKILGEILLEEGRINGDRFYTFGKPCKPRENNKFHYEILKRW